jgi:hypothetical protein
MRCDVNNLDRYKYLGTYFLTRHHPLEMHMFRAVAQQVIEQ